MLRRVARSRAGQRAAGVVLAEYLRLVWLTNKLRVEPDNIYDLADQLNPFIFAMWHGQHFMTPFFKPPHLKAKVLISRHRDGEINAIAAERLNIGAVRGSGDHDRNFTRKGGVAGFRGLLDALEQKYCVALTADVPKVARVAGPGIIALARHSGRPIVPIAVATSRRKELKNWDRSAINLPFGQIAMVAGFPIWVARDTDEAAAEDVRQELEDALNTVTARAYDIVDGGAQASRG